jgi:chromosome condensin MukBEF ATPase and DNA-binding subunit MukB
MAELINQIKADFKERASLLEGLWDSYVCIISFVLENFRKQSSEIEMAFLRKESRLHLIYDDSKTRIEKNMEEFKERLRVLEEENKRLRKDTAYLEKKKCVLEYEHRRKAMEAKMREKEMIFLKNDNLRLIYSLDKVLIDQQLQTPEIEFLRTQLKWFENNNNLSKVMRASFKSDDRELKSKIAKVEEAFIPNESSVY